MDFIIIYINSWLFGGIKMKGRMATNIGDIIIDNEVIAKYAGLTAIECYGIVGMAIISVKDGLQHHTD